MLTGRKKARVLLSSFITDRTGTLKRGQGLNNIACIREIRRFACGILKRCSALWNPTKSVIVRAVRVHRRSSGFGQQGLFTTSIIIEHTAKFVLERSIRIINRSD